MPQVYGQGISKVHVVTLQALFVQGVTPVFAHISRQDHQRWQATFLPLGYKIVY